MREPPLPPPLLAVPLPLFRGVALAPPLVEVTEGVGLAVTLPPTPPPPSLVAVGASGVVDGVAP